MALCGLTGLCRQCALVGAIITQIIFAIPAAIFLVNGTYFLAVAVITGLGGMLLGCVRCVTGWCVVAKCTINIFIWAVILAELGLAGFAGYTAYRFSEPMRNNWFDNDCAELYAHRENFKKLYSSCQVNRIWLYTGLVVTAIVAFLSLQVVCLINGMRKMGGTNYLKGVDDDEDEERPYGQNRQRQLMHTPQAGTHGGGSRGTGTLSSGHSNNAPVRSTVPQRIPVGPHPSPAHMFVGQQQQRVQSSPYGGASQASRLNPVSTSRIATNPIGGNHKTAAQLRDRIDAQPVKPPRVDDMKNLHHATAMLRERMGEPQVQGPTSSTPQGAISKGNAYNSGSNAEQGGPSAYGYASSSQLPAHSQNKHHMYASSASSGYNGGVSSYGQPSSLSKYSPQYTYTASQRPSGMPSYSGNVVGGYNSTGGHYSDQKQVDIPSPYTSIESVERSRMIMATITSAPIGSSLQSMPYESSVRTGSSLQSSQYDHFTPPYQALSHQTSSQTVGADGEPVDGAGAPGNNLPSVPSYYWRQDTPPHLAKTVARMNSNLDESGVYTFSPTSTSSPSEHNTFPYLGEGDEKLERESVDLDAVPSTSADDGAKMKARGKGSPQAGGTSKVEKEKAEVLQPALPPRMMGNKVVL